MSQTTVDVILIVVLTIGIIWDIWLDMDDVRQNTITHRVLAASKNTGFFPIILAGAFGTLSGHFFWPSFINSKVLEIAISANGFLWLVVSAIIPRPSRRVTLVAASLFIGYSAGHLWWPAL